MRSEASAWTGASSRPASRNLDAKAKLFSLGTGPTGCGSVLPGPPFAEPLGDVLRVQTDASAKPISG